MKQFVEQCILWYLRVWARIALRCTSATIIGIAGSAGKSSCKYALKAALHGYGNVLALDGNSETGIPLSILGIAPRGFSAMHWLR